VVVQTLFFIAGGLALGIAGNLATDLLQASWRRLKQATTRSLNSAEPVRELPKAPPIVLFLVIVWTEDRPNGPIERATDE
jgi:hypothetical protein